MFSRGVRNGCDRRVTILQKCAAPLEREREREDEEGARKKEMRGCIVRVKLHLTPGNCFTAVNSFCYITDLRNKTKKKN